MRSFIAFVFICLGSLSSFAQFTDDFSDGDFLNNPTWIGDTSHFSVNITSELQLDNAGQAGNSFLSTPSKAIKNGSWEFLVRFEFNPSSNNLARVYLVADTSILTVPLNGYFVQIGNTSDEVSLYRQDGTSLVELIDGQDDLVDTDPVFVKIKVNRDSLGMWSLHTDTSLSGSNFNLEGNALDTTYVSSDYVGVFCKYTTTRADKIFFDNFNISGGPYLDQIPPRLLNFTLVDQNTLSLRFNEKILAQSLDKTDFSLSGGFSSPDTLIQNGAELLLSWQNDFTNGNSFILNYSGFTDFAGNSILADSIQFNYYKAQQYDILITEIMPKPEPAVNLPEWEYVELFNNSSSNISLENWIFSDATSSKILPNVNLASGDRLIVCHEDAVALLISYGRTLGLGSFPSLNNSGDVLSIADSLGNMIHSVNYSSSWFQDPQKLKGGWSLEMIDPDFPCVGQKNWAASNSREGGTPGALNSVDDLNPDQNSPNLLKVGVDSPTKVILLFDEQLALLPAENAANYKIEPGSNLITSAKLGGDNLNEVELTLGQTLIEKTTYEITVSNLEDCSGNPMPVSQFSRLGLASKPLPGEILINEILFDAKSGSNDFLEIYNNSDKIVRLDQILVVRKDPSGQLQESDKVSESPLLLFPFEYLAVSDDVIDLKRHFPMAPDSSLLQSNVPSFPVDEAIVELQTLSLEMIDAFHYRSDMHYQLLSSKKGVSLERIRFDAPTMDEANWFSAAEEHGFGTPGYKNSQFRQATDMKLDLLLANKTVTPNGDGVDDILLVDYTTSKLGHTGSAYIYDASGNLIKILFRNRNLGSTGQIVWDGLSDNYQQVRTGPYIFLFESFNLEGNVKTFKEGFLIDLLH